MNLTFMQFKKFMISLLDSYATEHDLPEQQTLAKWISHFIAYVRVKIHQ